MTEKQNIFLKYDGSPMDLGGLYSGQSCFLVCNGKSFQNVDKRLLKNPGVLTMTMNNGGHDFRSNLWTGQDSPTRWMRSIWEDPTIQKFTLFSHRDKPYFADENNTEVRLVKDCPNVIFHRRHSKFEAENWLAEDKICWGIPQKTGGSRSTMLAALHILWFLGFKKVYLLGVDFEMSEDNKYWFDEERSQGAINNNNNLFRNVTGYLEQLKPYFDRVGFEVYNCNPDSKLKVFPYVSFDDAISAYDIGLTESTNGMYGGRIKQALKKIEQAKKTGGLIPIANEFTVKRTEFCKQCSNHTWLPDSKYTRHRQKLPKREAGHNRVLWCQISKERIDRIINCPENKKDFPIGRPPAPILPPLTEDKIIADYQRAAKGIIKAGKQVVTLDEYLKKRNICINCNGGYHCPHYCCGIQAQLALPEWQCRDGKHSEDYKNKSVVIIRATDSSAALSIRAYCTQHLQTAAACVKVITVTANSGDRSIERMYTQLLESAEQATEDYVYVCEHDCLYHPSRFNFMPAADDIFYYSPAVYQLTAYGFRFRKSKLLSTLICNRKMLILSLQQRLEAMAGGWKYKYIELGRHDPPNQTHTKINTYDCVLSVDIMHGNNWRTEPKRHYKYVEEIPYWGNYKDLWQKMGIDNTDTLILKNKIEGD